MNNESTKIAAKLVPSLKPRATFAAASFGNLRAAAGEGRGEPLRLLLADIDEDLNQPRQVFDADELQSMAESIKAHGVVQPVVVRPPVNGRYMLAFGARRFRASKLAGMPDIPAVVRATGTNELAAQIIENQQRANLSNSDLAGAIDRLVKEGLTVKQIGAICALKEYQVAAFRQVSNFPPELATRIDTADIRALYDLFRQWGKAPAEVIASLPDIETFITVTEARRIIGSITGKPTGSIILDRAKVSQENGQPAPAGEPTTAPPVQEPPPEKDLPPIKEPPSLGGLTVQEFTLTQQEHVTPAASQTGHYEFPVASKIPALQTVRPPEMKPQPVMQAKAATVSAPVFIVSLGDGQTGRLVLDQRAMREGAALVAYPTGMEEVDALELRIVRID